MTRKLQNETMRRRRLKPERIAPSDPPVVSGECNYFLRRPTDNVVQIGYSDNFRRRLIEHQREAKRHGGYQWEVLAVVQGDRASETALKNYFSAYAYNGETEWFNPAVEIYRYLRWLRDRSFVAISSEDQIEPVASENWLPNTERHLVPPLDLLYRQETALAPRVLTRDDYYTPTELIDAVRTGMGGIDVDPASHPAANQRHRIPTYYTKATNGLGRDWIGRVWLNPPFSAWEDWVSKALRELSSGRVLQLTALMTTQTMTALYVQPFIARAAAFILIRGRLEFWGKHVDEGNGAGASCGHVLIYFGDRVAEMQRALSGVGMLWVPYAKRQGELFA